MQSQKEVLVTLWLDAHFYRRFKRIDSHTSAPCSTGDGPKHVKPAFSKNRWRFCLQSSSMVFTEGIFLTWSMYDLNILDPIPCLRRECSTTTEWIHRREPSESWWLMLWWVKDSSLVKVPLINPTSCPSFSQTKKNGFAYLSRYSIFSAVAASSGGYDEDSSKIICGRWLTPAAFKSTIF